MAFVEPAIWPSDAKRSESTSICVSLYLEEHLSQTRVEPSPWKIPKNVKEFLGLCLTVQFASISQPLTLLGLKIVRRLLVPDQYSGFSLDQAFVVETIYHPVAYAATTVSLSFSGLGYEQCIAILSPSTLAGGLQAWEE